MTLATKNGSLIVKDGKVAENCGCCGDWYCCEDPICAMQDIKSISVQMSAVGYFLQRQYRWSCIGFDVAPLANDFYVSAGFDGPSLTGSFALTKQNALLWSKSIAVTGGCSATISVTFNTTDVVSFLEVVVYASGVQSTGVADYKTLSQLPCVTPVGPWAGGWSNAGDVASQTIASVRHVLVSLAGDGGCYSLDAANQSPFPVTFRVAVPYFTSRSCSERSSQGDVSTAVESGSQDVSITGIVFGR